MHSLQKIILSRKFKWRHVFLWLFIFCVLLVMYMCMTLSKTSSVDKRLNFQKETTVLRWNGKSWENVYRFCSKEYNFSSAIFKSPSGTIPMYIHSLKRDLFVSVSLNHTGIWDREGLELVYEQLKADPDIGLLDIGAQLGTFSLTAALLGHQVVAVDPLVENVIRLCQTVQRNGLVNYVTIIFAALSDTHKNMAIKRPRGNLGGTHVEETNERYTTHKYPRYFIEAVPLDELLPILDLQKVFLKLDVESHEYFVLSGGKRLFQTLNVRGVLMEWDFLRTWPYGQDVVDFLTKRNFQPFSVSWKEHQLDLRHFKSWPFDVFWKKKD